MKNKFINKTTFILATTMAFLFAAPVFAAEEEQITDINEENFDYTYEDVENLISEFERVNAEENLTEEDEQKTLDGATYVISAEEYLDDEDLETDDYLANSYSQDDREFYELLKSMAGYTAPYLEGEYVYASDIFGEKSLVRNTWVDIGSKTYYVNADGRVHQGKKTLNRGMGNEDFYFTLDEGLVKNKKVIADGGYFTANATGNLSLIQRPTEGFTSFNDKTYFFDQRGKLLKGMSDLGNNRYFFDPYYGHMYYNQLVDYKGKTIITNGLGVAKYQGFDYYNGKYSYNNRDGSYRTGMQTIDGKKYFFGLDGDMKRDSYQKVGNQWYYFNKYGEGSKSNGKHKRGWDGYYYYHPDGKLARGYTRIDGYLHYFNDKSGRLGKNHYGVYNNKLYYFGSNGVGTYIKTLPHSVATPGTRGDFTPGFSRNDLGRKTPYLSQNDPRWRKTPYGKTHDTYGAVGCGPTALAMVLNRELDRTDIYPTTVGKDLYDYSGYGGTEWTAITDYPQRYGLNTYEVPITKEALIQAVAEHPVIIRVGPGYFIDGGHFLVIDSYKDGKFVINDPFFYYRNTDVSHSFERIKKEATIAWQIK